MGFLFHPILVHFPIAFYFLEFFLLILWIIRHEDLYRDFAYFVFRLGYAFMIAAMIAGYVDAGGIHSKVWKHFISAAVLLTVYTLRGLLWFRMAKRGDFNSWFLSLTSFAGVLLVCVTGDLGAKMVYQF